MQLEMDCSVATDAGRKSDLWVAFLFPAILALGMALSVWSDLRGFRGKAPFLEARGTVAKLECDNHGEYQVTYSANGQVFPRGAGNLNLRANCKDLNVGQPARVWYSASDPAYASFVSPENAVSYMKGELTVLLFVGYPLLVGFVFVARRFGYFKRKAA